LLSLFVFYFFSFAFVYIKTNCDFFFEKIVKVVSFYFVNFLKNMSHKKSTKNISLFSVKHINIGFLGFDSVFGMSIILEK